MPEFKHVPTRDRSAVLNLPLKDLVAGAREGLDTHIGVLRQRYGREVMAAIYGLVPSAASEVLDDVFLALPDLLEDYEERGNFLPWLRRIAKNRALTAARSVRNRAKHEVPMPTKLAGPAAPKLADMSMEHRALREWLLERLDDREREVWLLYEQRYSHREIAERLGVTEANSQKILSRARARLRAASAEWLKDPTQRGE